MKQSLENEKISEVIQRTEVQNQMLAQQPDRLQILVDWINNCKTDRSIEIKIRTPKYGGTEIWAYDYDLNQGAFIDIKDVGNITNLDFKGKHDKAEYKEYMALKAKFEKGDNNAN